MPRRFRIQFVFLAGFFSALAFGESPSRAATWNDWIERYATGSPFVFSTPNARLRLPEDSLVAAVKGARRVDYFSGKERREVEVASIERQLAEQRAMARAYSEAGFNADRDPLFVALLANLFREVSSDTLVLVSVGYAHAVEYFLARPRAGAAYSSQRLGEESTLFSRDFHEFYYFLPDRMKLYLNQVLKGYLGPESLASLARGKAVPYRERNILSALVDYAALAEDRFPGTFDAKAVLRKTPERKNVVFLAENHMLDCQLWEKTFPSAEALRAAGFRRILLITEHLKEWLPQAIAYEPGLLPGAFRARLLGGDLSRLWPSLRLSDEAKPISFGEALRTRAEAARSWRLLSEGDVELYPSSASLARLFDRLWSEGVPLFLLSPELPQTPASLNSKRLLAGLREWNRISESARRARPGAGTAPGESLRVVEDRLAADLPLTAELRRAVPRSSEATHAPSLYGQDPTDVFSPRGRRRSSITSWKS